MVIAILKNSHDDFLIRIHLDFNVIAVCMVDGNDGICECPVQILIGMFCPVIINFTVQRIIFIIQTIDKQNRTAPG